jgi:hypothetical protein
MIRASIRKWWTIPAPRERYAPTWPA